MNIVVFEMICCSCSQLGHRMVTLKDCLWNGVTLAYGGCVCDTQLCSTWLVGICKSLAIHHRVDGQGTVFEGDGTELANTLWPNGEVLFTFCADSQLYPTKLPRQLPLPPNNLSASHHCQLLSLFYLLITSKLWLAEF